MKLAAVAQKLNNLSEAEIQQLAGVGILTEEDLYQVRRALNALRGRDDKSFMDMLRSVNRNHYLLNQMVDRKGRILLSVNTLLLSLLIGGAISTPVLINWQFILLGFLGICSLISCIAAMIAIAPERVHGSLSHQDILDKKGNPLFFGNFKSLPEQTYEDTMMEMVNDRDFVYRAMIQDIYHLGQILEEKRKYLRTALYVFVGGLIIGLLTALSMHIWVASQLTEF